MAWITWFSQNCFWIFLSEVIQLDCGWNCNWRIPLHRFSSQEPVRDFCGYCSWASRGRWDLIKMELMSLLHFFRRNSWQVFKIVVAVAFDFDIYYGQVTLSRLIPPTINRSHSVWRSNSPLIFTIVVLRQKKSRPAWLPGFNWKLRVLRRWTTSNFDSQKLQPPILRLCRRQIRLVAGRGRVCFADSFHLRI